MEVEMDFDGEYVCYEHIIEIQSTETSNCFYCFFNRVVLLTRGSFLTKLQF